MNFINSFSDILNENSTLILSHHDFDSAIYNSSFKWLTRKLIHHFSDTQQEWQKHSDSQMGRKIPGLIKQSIFCNHAKLEIWRLVDATFKVGTYGFLMANMLMEIGKEAFDPVDLRTWYADLEQKVNLMNIILRLT